MTSQPKLLATPAALCELAGSPTSWVDGLALPQGMPIRDCIGDLSVKKERARRSIQGADATLVPTC
jgi:hypothetical protein